jgi:ABC-type amino acid transport system permease subunit
MHVHVMHLKNTDTNMKRNLYKKMGHELYQQQTGCSIDQSFIKYNNYGSTLAKFRLSVHLLNIEVS